MLSERGQLTRDVTWTEILFGERSNMSSPSISAEGRLSRVGASPMCDAPVALENILAAALRHVYGGDGRPFLLVGPGGVGKSTCARALARSLGRSVAVFDVGIAGLRLGQRDGLRELPLIPRGVGQPVVSPSGAAPVIIIEHADRLPGGLAGGLLATLVDIATERSPRALDHYFGVESQAESAVFVFTTRAGVSPGLDGILFVLELVGYSLSDKAAIATRLFEDAGRHLPSALVQQLVRLYAKGPGVDAIVALVEKTRELSDDEMVPARLLPLMAAPALSALARYATPLPGQAITMAWGRDGGSLFVIEVCFGKEADGDLKVLGNVGEVMEGAARIALHATNAVLDPAQHLGAATRRPVLMNFPGSWRNAGAAAGLAMGLAMYGLATGRRVRPALAVTGELTLGGLVLPVRGCTTQLLAAEQEQLDGVILPDGNRGAARDVAARLRGGLNISFVSAFSEAIASSFV